VRRETNRAHMGLAKLALYLVIPGLFLLIPTPWLEAHPAPCLYRALLKRRCPGCGMTRALSAALHGHLKRAWSQNKLVTVVLPLGILVWLQGLAAAYQEWRLGVAGRQDGAGRNSHLPGASTRSGR
jgi:Protein of unknown function (DUF2752)